MADAAIATGSKPSRLAPRDATRLITAAERSFYGEQGYLRVDRPMVDAAAIKEVRDILDGLFADADAPEGYVHELGAVGTYGSVPEIIWPSLLRPQLKRTKVFAMMRELALELLDVDRVRLHFDHAIFKPPFNAGPTAWHQDVVFDPTHDCPVATIWFALVEATEDNGCMMFVPGSHRPTPRARDQFSDAGQNRARIRSRGDRRIPRPVHTRSNSRDRSAPSS